MSTAVYAGSFDPPTNGHLWMIQRGLEMFERLIVAIGSNPSKSYTFSVEERLELLRQTTAALGLTSLGGHAQTVRPLVAPMGAAAAERVTGKLSDALRQRIFALAAATDNVALFFGEDLFIAFGAVLLTQGVFRQHGIDLDPLRIALWGLPTAILALLIHGARLVRFDRRLEKEP